MAFVNRNRLNINAATLFNALGGGSPLSIINSIVGASYRILKHKTSENALGFDGVVALQPTKGASILTAPVAQGQYGAFNKIQSPGKLTVRVAINGFTGYSGSIPNLANLTLTSQSDILAAIDDMIANTDLYDIETPKETFVSYDLVGKDYSVTARNGVTLLVVNLFFQEVIQATEVVLSSPATRNRPAANATAKSASAVTESVPGNTRSVSLDTVKTVRKSLARSGQPVPAPGFNSALKTVGQSPQAVGSATGNALRQDIHAIAQGLF